jgi:hypothetical protein
MKRTLPTTAAVLLLGASLTACSGGGGGSTTTVTPPAAKFEAQFGSGFATDFQANNNSEPHAVAVGDVVPVNQTAEPVPLPSS